MAPAGKDGAIKQVIAIMSGKGGVGKSLVTGLLAVSLRSQGLRILSWTVTSRVPVLRVCSARGVNPANRPVVVSSR